MTGGLELKVVDGLPEVHEGDDLAEIIKSGLDRSNVALTDGDVLVVAQKVVSKAEGRLIELSSVEPSREARDLAASTGLDPRKVEVILGESRRLVRVTKQRGDRPGLIICEHNLGLICANAGVDESNTGASDAVLCLPSDPDASAEHLMSSLQASTEARVGVVISDTFGRPWRLGQVNVAIGLAGLPAFRDFIGTEDRDGRMLTGTQHALADEVAAAVGMMMGKADGRPAVVVRGLDWRPVRSSAQGLLRTAQEDLFR